GRRRRHHQHGGDGHQREAGQKTEAGAKAPQPDAQQELHGSDRERDQDRRDRERAVHGVPSSPSTWSLPARPRDVSSTTRNKAVVAKPMTIAVSTSACGSGSA